MKKERSYRKIVLIGIAVVVYVSLCISKFDSEFQSVNLSYFEAIGKASLSPDSILLKLDNKELLDDNYLLSLKDKHVYADSLAYTISYENNSRYLKAQIPNGNQKRILLKLEIDSDYLIDSRSVEFSRMLLAADITNVKLLPVYKTLETFERSVLWSSVEYDVLLEGKLSEILYQSKI